jgi:hypothetical protein
VATVEHAHEAAPAPTVAVGTRGARGLHATTREPARPLPSALRPAEIVELEVVPVALRALGVPSDHAPVKGSVPLAPAQARDVATAGHSHAHATAPVHGLAGAAVLERAHAPQGLWPIRAVAIADLRVALAPRLVSGLVGVAARAKELVLQTPSPIKAAATVAPKPEPVQLVAPGQAGVAAAAKGPASSALPKIRIVEIAVTRIVPAPGAVHGAPGALVRTREYVWLEP